MPVYDMKCLGDCGYFADIVCTVEDLPKIICPSCKGRMRVVISAVPTIGPMPSKPLVVNHIGRTFHSNGEWNQYQRQNPDVEIVSASSGSWREHVDFVRGKAEGRAKREGYRDLADKRTQRKKAKAPSEKKVSIGLT
jgi:hypothetical protein